MIQITAQMGVLVAIEPVDGRKYAPSMDLSALEGFGTGTSPRLNMLN
jgi:hypothetical protein